MSAIKGTITIRRYAVLDMPEDYPRARMMKGIRAHMFLPIDPQSDALSSTGWVSIENSEDADLHPEKTHFGDQVRLSLRIDVLKPAPADVKRLLGPKIAAMAAEEGRPLSRRERALLKEEVVRDLKKRLLPKAKLIDMVWHLDENRVYFWSQGKGANESFVDLFVKSFGLRIEVEDASRWTNELLLGQVARKTIAPTMELWNGFKGVRPLGTQPVEDA